MTNKNEMPDVIWLSPKLYPNDTGNEWSDEQHLGTVKYTRADLVPQPITDDGVKAALDELINTNCQEDTKFLRTKIIDYSDYPNEGCEHLENMCIVINKMRKQLIGYRTDLTSLDQVKRERDLLAVYIAETVMPSEEYRQARSIAQRIVAEVGR